MSRAIENLSPRIDTESNNLTIHDLRNGSRLDFKQIANSLTFQILSESRMKVPLIARLIHRHRDLHRYLFAFHSHCKVLNRFGSDNGEKRTPNRWSAVRVSSRPLFLFQSTE